MEIKELNDLGDMLRPEEVAEMLKITMGTLQKWRLENRGPRFLRIGGGVVRYPSVWMREYLMQNAASVDSVASRREPGEDDEA
jgi:hypothetical protein